MACDKLTGLLDFTIRTWKACTTVPISKALLNLYNVATGH
jgi:hypothetical protein